MPQTREERQKGFLEDLKKLNDKYKMDIRATFQATSNKIGDVVAVPILVDLEELEKQESKVIKP